MAAYIWADALPEAVPRAGFAEFLERYRALSMRLLERQHEFAAEPDALPAFEYVLEQQLVELVHDALGPGRVLAEEYFARHRTEIPGQGRLSFVLDPLDGSASYLRSSPRFATSLAVLCDERPVLALIHEPATGLLYAAVAGSGAYREHEPIRHEPQQSGRVAVVKAQWIEREPELARRVAAIEAAGYELERMEATALKLCWLAEGRRAGLLKWLSSNGGVVQHWGTTAGLLVCAELGLTPRRLDGRPWRGEAGGLLIGDAAFLGDLGAVPDGAHFHSNRL